MRFSQYLLASVAPIVLASGMAQAQSVTPPPLYLNTDANGVDLTTGYVSVDIPEGSIGDGEGGISLVQTYGLGFTGNDNWSGNLHTEVSNNSEPTVRVEFGAISKLFRISNGGYESLKGEGDILVRTSSGNYEYTSSDGTKIIYRSGSDSGYGLRGPNCQTDAAICSIPISVTKPNGMRFTLDWNIEEVEQGCGGVVQQGAQTNGMTTNATQSSQTTMDPPTTNATTCTRRAYYRLSSIQSSAGYAVSFSYDLNSVASSSAWFEVVSPSWTVWRLS